MERITIAVNGEDVELKLTPARADILLDLTGLDVMKGFSIDPGDKRVVYAFAYALANGVKGTGLDLDEFLDAFPFGEVGSWPAKFEAVMKRDMPRGESGNAPRPKKGTKKAA